MPKGKAPPEPEPDEEPVIPAEPAGAALTDLRKRQADGRLAAEKLWQEITHNIQKAKEKPNGH